MRLCNVWEVLEDILYGEVQCDHGSWVALGDQLLKMLVLFDEFILHGVPHHLVEKKDINITINVKKNSYIILKNRQGN